MATAKKTSTAVAVKKPAAGGLVSVQEMMKAQLAALANKTAPASGNSIRVTQDKQFVLPDGTKTRGPIQVVVVDFTSRNEYYDGEFDKENISPPACFAIGDNPKALIASDNSPDKQCEDCNSCPMNAFGSRGKGKACKNTRVLAVMQPDAEKDDPLWTLKVSPTGIKGWDSYAQSVGRQFGVPPAGVVTTVSFDDNSDYPSLKFSEPEINENAAVAMSRLEDAKAMLAAEPDVSQYAKPVKVVKQTPARKPVTAGRR
jgi:hypothetical protein